MFLENMGQRQKNLQSKRQSMIETLTSVFVGWIIGVILNMLVLPLFDYDVSLTDGVLISIIFTAVSIIRSYVIRRWFNSKEEQVTLIEDLRYQRELLVKQVFESELTIVKQYLLGIVEGYDRCIKLVEYYEVDDLSMIEDVDVWEDGDKIRCINDSEQNTLKLNEIYTVDTSMNTTDNRVYVKENKRFSFLKSRFELVEV